MKFVIPLFTDQVQNHQQAHQHPSAQHGQHPDHHQFFNNNVEQKHVDTGNISNSNTSDTQAAMTTLMQQTAQTLVQQKIMGNPHLNHHEAMGSGFESRLVSLKNLSFYWERNPYRNCKKLTVFVLVIFRNKLL